LLAAGVVVPLYVILLVTYGTSPKTTDVGYAPMQPVAFSHALHAGELELDCRHCHAVEDSAHAALPTLQTCLICHTHLSTYGEAFRPVLDASAMGEPIAWVRVHDLPDYARFDHRIHIHRGIACTTCHGRVYEMEEVRQVAPLSMSWCLDCHREPEWYLQPLHALADREWEPTYDRFTLGRNVREELNVNPSTDCSACHR
jgi:hypothetical protein